MNKLLVLAVLGLAIPCRAQQGHGEIFIEGIDIPEGLKGSVKDFREARAPAAIDKKPVDELFDRLAQPWNGTDGSLAAARPVAQDGTQEVVAVSLVEVEGPKQESDVTDLLYRRYFSHIEARSETWKDLPKGEKQIVVWRYRIGLGGTIVAVRKETLIGKLVDPSKGSEGLQADRKRSKIEDKRPKDPEGLSKWKDLAPKLCSLRPTRTI